jgi:2-amino-4-hydroxy-6-hydroxymethyldihydropteridine diphosphokinase
MPQARASQAESTVNNLINREKWRLVLLALGANLRGSWGHPGDTFRRAIEELSSIGVRTLAASRFYCTPPVGHGRQNRYLNAVLLTEAALPPAALLLALKAVERRAGRRLGRHWGPRVLDIDILDFRGRRIGWPPPSRRIRGQLIAPHPELHRRAFVLRPLLDVAPSWRHPVSGATARVLLARLPRHERLGPRPVPGPKP